MSSYADCQDLDALIRTMDLSETKEQIAGELLERGWYSLVTRKTPYSSGGHAWVVETFVLMQDNKNPSAFTVGATGNIICSSNGRDECIYKPIEEKDVVYNVYVDLARRACYVTHETRFFSLYRYSLEAHFKNEKKYKTDQKTAAFKFLRANVDAVNPAEFPSFMKAIFKEAKKGANDEKVLEKLMRNQFKERYKMYGSLKAMEAEEKKKKEAVTTSSPSPSPPPSPSPAVGEQQQQQQETVPETDKTPKKDEGKNLFSFTEAESSVVTTRDESMMTTLTKMVAKTPEPSSPSEPSASSSPQPASPSYGTPSPPPSVPVVEASPTQLQPQNTADRPFLTFDEGHSAAILDCFSAQPTISS